MATKFAEVEIGGLEQGEFMKRCEEQFAILQKEVLDHVEKMDNKDGKATGILVMKVAIQYENKGYRILTEAERRRPKKNHIGVSTAFVNQSQTGQMQLFAQASGTTSGNPRQSVLCTNDGKIVPPGDTKD